MHAIGADTYDAAMSGDAFEREYLTGENVIHREKVAFRAAFVSFTSDSSSSTLSISESGCVYE